MGLEFLELPAAKINQLKAAGIETVEDLFAFFPKHYEDMRYPTGIKPETEPSCIIVTPKSVQFYNNPGRMSCVRARAYDMESKNHIIITWFRQDWMYEKVNALIGQQVLLVGKLKYDPQYNNYTISNPAVFTTEIAQYMRIRPQYKAIKGMAADYLYYNVIMPAVRAQGNKPDELPMDLLKATGLCSTAQMIHGIHTPDTAKEVRTAWARRHFDELLSCALHLELAKQENRGTSNYLLSNISAVPKITNKLPFMLTEDQTATLQDMIRDAERGKRINAMVQGDVGVGKTVIAQILAAAFASSGFQTAVTVPTQVLAKQHYDEFLSILEPCGICVVQLGAEKQTAAEKRATLAKIQSGEAKVIVGTSALLSNSVKYHALALTIIDEEHKFGINQRAALAKKAADGVHKLNMSATPIPRTLADVVYGECVHLYTIKSIPKGRQPIVTSATDKLENTLQEVLRRIKAREQVYVVCPKIDYDDENTIMSVEEVSALYKEKLGKYGVRIATLTGRDKPEMAAQTIENFKDGLIDVLIATTIVEVGVNVPNATLMIISNAERFGLASMHQLRGRVGRGTKASSCILVSESQPGEKAYERIKTMCECSSGYALAEADLRLRGAGDFLSGGTKQAGENRYIMLSMAYPDLQKAARRAAAELLNRGPDCCAFVREFYRSLDEAQTQAL